MFTVSARPFLMLVLFSACAVAPSKMTWATGGAQPSGRAVKNSALRQKSLARTDLTLSGLKGSVRTVLVESGADVNGLVRTAQTTYDSAGYLTESLAYDGKGELVQKAVYKYDGGHKLTERIDYEGKNAVTRKVVYAYDSDGGRIGAITYSPDGKEYSKTTYANNGRGYLVHETTDAVPVIPAFTETKQYVYNSGGQLTTLLEKSTIGTRETHYEYSSDGHLTLVRFESMADKRRTSYNDAGLIKEESRTLLGTDYLKTYAYEFDSQDNWIKQTTTETSRGTGVFGSRKPVTAIVRRTITYF